MSTAYTTRRSLVARVALDEAAALEAVEQPRDPGGGEDDLLGEVDAPHTPVGRAREPKQHLEVADREAVIGGQLRR